MKRRNKTVVARTGTTNISDQLKTNVGDRPFDERRSAWKTISSNLIFNLLLMSRVHAVWPDLEQLREKAVLKKRKSISYVLAFMPFLFFGKNLSAQEAENQVEGRAKKTFPGQMYSTLDFFQCGENRISINSSCVANDDENSDPYCPAQNVSFINIAQRKAHTVTYRYDTDRQEFIYGAACLKLGSDFFVELSSSNLGSCSNCEWLDYFGIDGEYIGSSDETARNINLKRKALEPSAMKKFFMVTRESEISLTTIAR